MQAKRRHKPMRLRLLLVMILTVLVLQAQEQHSWEQYLNQVMNAEDMASEQWQENYDLLCELEQNPININKTTREELEQIPFLSTQQVEALEEYIYIYGSMKSLAELQMINEIGPQVRKLLESFIYVGDEPKQKPPFRHELVANGRVPFYERKGDEDGYLGNRYRHWFRYQVERGDNIKLGLVASQDAGEPFFTNENKYGYDYYSPYLQLKKMGRMETFVLGNYRVSMGMGMVMNNSFGLGKIAILQNLGRNSIGLRAHSSRSEGYLQGAGSTINLGRGVRTTAFVSYAPMDATLNDDGSARTILTSGYHRTETEMEKKHNMHVLKTGGTIRYDVGRMHIALNALYNHLDRELRPNKKQMYNYYKPEGTNFMNASIDYGYRGRRWALNGETAADDRGHIATINTISVSTRNNINVMVLQRFYAYQYTSLDAQSYSDGGKIQNESGVYVGLSWQPSPTWQLTAYTDYAYHPWPTYRESTASYSLDNLIQCIHATEKWKLMGRYRLKVKEQEHRTRLSIEYSSSLFSVRTQFDGGCCTAEKTELGAMISENVAYNRDWLRLNVGVGYFYTDSYNSRVYLYENGPLYTYCMQQFYGKGIRCWLMLRASVGRKLTLTAKLGVTDYFDRDKISSGYQQINQSSQTDLDIQVRWRI